MPSTKHPNQKRPTGFSVLEVLISAALLSTVLISIWGVFIYANTQVAIARARSVATYLATEQMEIYRNMPYDDLGTTTGHPNGSIPATQTLTRNGIDFTVETTVRYYDDPNDGVIGGLYVGKHVEYWPVDCSFDPATATTLTIDFYTDGVQEELDFQDHYHGVNFNWAGSINVGGSDQHFHIHTGDNSGCETLRIQTQNVERPFRFYVDGVLWVTYSDADTFSPESGINHYIIGSGGTTIDDLYPNDYKQLEVEVCWNIYQCSSPVKLTTFVAQFGQETAENTGVMVIEVIDASGDPVPNATIHIENPTLGIPAIDETTDIEGRRAIPVLDPSVEGYEVTVSKSGFSTEQTYSVSVANPFPYPNHLTINAEQITESTFVIDLLGELQLTVHEADDSPAAGATVRVEGSKVISDQAPLVKKYAEQSFTLDGDGKLTLEDLEYDTYLITAELAGGDVTEAVYLAPNTLKSYLLTPHTLTVEVDDSATSLSLQDAEVQLTHSVSGEVRLVLTNALGQANFSSLETGDWNYLIALEDYDDATGTFTIAAGSNSETVQLTETP